MSSNGNQVPLAPSQRGPGPYPRASTPHRPVECYHPSGAAGAAYMPSTAGGAQPSAQATLRVQPTPQPSAPPAPQQDMSKTTMAGHSYVSQNQTQQPRPQYTNFQYRTAQHGARPNTHPRQQQSFIPSGTATATGPVMYPTLVFQPTPMGMQTYQQPRSNTPGYYPYMGHYIGYNTPPNHNSYYYTSNNPQLPAPNLQGNNPGGRNNPTTLVGPQGTPATPTPPTATLPHAQAHMHPNMPGIRPPVQKRQSHRLPIIDPVTQQDIFSDLYSNDNFLSGETNDRQTPQPEHSVVQEFNRMVNEVANQPSCDSALKSNFVTTKNVEPPVSSTANSVQIQPNAISSVNNNIVKSDLLTVNETKNLGPDVVVVANETPIVSAISDSPVIVPKMPTSNKQLQKNSDQNVQSLVLDTNKNIPPNKQLKQNKNVPQNEEVDKPSDNVNPPPIATIAPISITPIAPVAAVSAPVPVPIITTPSTQTPIPTPAPAPQPQRIREPRERVKSEAKEKSKDRESQEKEAPPATSNPNGPTPGVISSVDSSPEVISLPTSQSNQTAGPEPVTKQVVEKQSPLAPEPEIPAVVETNVEIVNKSEPVLETPPTATQLLSASIEKVAKEQHSAPHKAIEVKEAASGIEAQAKLTQSISSVLRSNQPESKMKDINLNNKTTDPDTANRNQTEVTKNETVNEDINKNEKVVKSSMNTNKKSSSKMPNSEVNVTESESYENGKNETDTVVSNVEKDKSNPAEETTPSKPSLEEPAKAEQTPAPAAFVPKYKYSEDQWSPLNKSGKKCYDVGLLKQIKEDPLSKNKPNAPLLEACNVIRTTPMQEPQPFTPISRPMNDSLLPPFAKPGMGFRNNAPRDAKKDSRNMAQSKGSVKLNPNPNANNPHKAIYVSLSLREEVKLNEVDSAWKPTRFRKENYNEEEVKTQELYKKFRGILNKLTPQKFDTLLDKVKTLEINNQKRLEGVIDLVFEKAIDEPNFSEAYAGMCNKLSMLKVPADNTTSPEHFVNFRALIINKCQNQFQADKVDAQILKLEKELAECSDPAKKKELQLMLEEENRRVRMRSVGNVRFIGELYKLKMLTSKIMDYCMKYLIDKAEEEKLECLCKLLTTIGEQVENEVHGQLDNIFKKMQEIVDRKHNKISSRVRFMLQDVIELRKRKWVAKTVIDSQPKMMDQIQKEAEQQQRHIELMNAGPVGGFRRDEGGRGKRGDGRRQNSSNSFMDSAWKTTKTTNFPVDTSKLKAVTGSQKNLNNIKLAPHNLAWNHGSGTKNTVQPTSNPMFSLSKNKYSVLENAQTDPASLRANRDMTPNYHSKGASIERSTFNSRGDLTSSSGSRSGSVGMARSNSGTRSTSAATPTPPVVTETAAPATTSVPQEPLPDNKKKSVKSMIELCFINPDDDELVAEVKQYYPPQYHAAVVTEILNVALDKASKQNGMIAKSLLHLVSTGTISPDNFLAGIKEILLAAPDLYIDIPMLYDNLGKIIGPQIEKKHIAFVQIFRLCDTVISSNEGHLLLKAIFRELKDSMGPSFVKSKWQESGLQFKQWMDEEQVTTWLQDNKFEFLEGDSKACEENKKILTPAQTQVKLFQLMNADESFECIKGWLQDNFGKSTNEDWFMRALIQAICEHALFGSEGRDVPHFNQDRMNKYAGLIHEFGETKQSREASCLFGIQQLIRKLEHPKGLTLEIFQYLHEQYLISFDGFIAWEVSEKEPEGKGVMMKALTSFFTNIKEADNEDSCSED